MLAKSAQPLCMYHECNLDMYEEYVIDHIDHDIAQVFMTVMLTANLQYMRLSLHPVYSIKNQYKSKRKFFPEPRFALFQRPQRSKTFLLSCGDEDDGDRIIRRAPLLCLPFPPLLSCFIILPPAESEQKERSLSPFFRHACSSKPTSRRSFGY